MIADPGLDDGERALDRGDGRRAAHRRGGGKTQILDTEIGDEVLGDRAVTVGNEAVDVRRLQAGVTDRVQRGFELKRKRGAVGPAEIFRFSNAGDGACFPQRHEAVSFPWTASCYAIDGRWQTYSAAMAASLPGYACSSSSASS